MAGGYCCLVLHAHLPFVRHPEFEDSLEERWLYEAITESYLPLLKIMEGWRRDGLDWRLTLSLSPPLMTMLADKLLQERYAQHIGRLIELAESEVVRTKWLGHLQPTALHYREAFTEIRATFEEVYRRDLLGAFASFQTAGNLELLTSSATHAFLPLMQHQPASVRAQIQIGVDAYVDHFGRPPRGFWNAECGYYPGLDALLHDAGLKYFFLDAHGILQAQQHPRYEVFAPILCPSGIAAFGRDVDSSRAVWSAQLGYPSDPAYRDFYRDLGHDAEFDYVAPYIHESGQRVATGIKYHRVTGPVPLGKKELYDRPAALQRAEEHAEDFVRQRTRHVAQLSELMDRPPLIVAPYDAELFGHWWYEGPTFLDQVMRKLCASGEVLQPITPTQYLSRHKRNQILTPVYSSWGEGGYAEVWLNPSNDWIYRFLHAATDRMAELARRYQGTDQAGLRRALNQMARELLLAQSSDWAFIMKMGTMVEYAVNRTKEHLENFNQLYDRLLAGAIVDEDIHRLETRNNIFPNLQFEIFTPREN